MKRTNITFWIVTILFSAFMLSSAIPEVLLVPDAEKLITGLGYPKYFIPFIGVAKILGVIAILIPGNKWVKEWAYAGLFFDLSGATFSALSAGGWDPRISFMILPIGFLFWSHYLHHKRLAAKRTNG